MKKKILHALRLEGTYPCYYLVQMLTGSSCGNPSSADTGLSPGRDKWGSNVNH